MSNPQEFTDETLVQAWGLTVDNFNRVFDLLSDGYLTPTEREGFESDYAHLAEHVGALQEEMYRRKMFNDTPTLKPEFAKFLAQGRDDKPNLKPEEFYFNGCKMCGVEWKSLNEDGYCSSCWTVWNS
jgi:hypothetical protein